MTKSDQADNISSSNFRPSKISFSWAESKTIQKNLLLKKKRFSLSSVKRHTEHTMWAVWINIKSDHTMLESAAVLQTMQWFPGHAHRTDVYIYKHVHNM